MKLNKLIYGILTVTVLSACADKMEYHEYNNYDEDYVKLNFRCFRLPVFRSGRIERLCIRDGISIVFE